MQRGFSYQQLVLRDSQRGGKLKFVCCGKASRLFVQFYLPTPENTDNCGKTLHMNMPKLAKKKAGNYFGWGWGVAAESDWLLLILWRACVCVFLKHNGIISAQGHFWSTLFPKNSRDIFAVFSL